MVMLARPRPVNQPPRKKRLPRCVRLRGAECPVHNGPVYLDGNRVFCPACERYKPTSTGGADMDVPALIDGKPNAALLRYMGTVCRRLNRSDDPMDFFQESVLTLMRRARRYDPARGKATTFALWICLSVRGSRASSLRCKPGHDPHHSLRFEAREVSDPPDHRTPDPADVAERAELVALVGPAVASLPGEQAELLTRRFGLDGREPALLRELGGHDTREAARQRVGRALASLRWRLGPVAVTD